MASGPHTESVTLSGQLAVALDATSERPLQGLADAEPASRRDRALVLLQVHDLHRAPLADLGDRVRWQHHPAIASLKSRLETAWVAELDARIDGDLDEGGAAETLRAIAARDRAPAVYQWLAEDAGWDAVLRFLALEGGPDDIFDDLVATCQVGLPVGPAKMELASNYWDEMGNGEVDKVHNVLYRRFVDAVDLPTVARHDQPTEALERSAMLGLVATNRALQPEMVGALGLIELTAGPRCRYVDQGLGRLGANEDARAFYQMHAVVDPLHGKGWLDNAVRPLADRRPSWGPRILRGAAWKSEVDMTFFDWAERALALSPTG